MFTSQVIKYAVFVLELWPLSKGNGVVQIYENTILHGSLDIALVDPKHCTLKMLEFPPAAHYDAVVDNIHNAEQEAHQKENCESSIKTVLFCLGCIVCCHGGQSTAGIRPITSTA